jgi:hypothetical protein
MSLAEGVRLYVGSWDGMHGKPHVTITESKPLSISVYDVLPCVAWIHRRLVC